nr:uncharacterized protein LOC127335900 [Lolium perenne]
MTPRTSPLPSSSTPMVTARLYFLFIDSAVAVSFRLGPTPGSRSGDVRYDEFSDKFFCNLSQVQDDDVSKVTLPAWPGQGYGRHWLSSGLLVQFVSCPYSDAFDLLYDLDLCIVYLYLDSLESLL